MQRSPIYAKNIDMGGGSIIRKGFTFAYGFSVPTQANRPEFKLEFSSPVQTDWVLGIQTRRRVSRFDAQGAETVLSRSANGLPIVNDEVFFSSFLTLKQRTAEVFDSIPLQNIYQANLNGIVYQVDIPSIDMAQSSIKVSNEAAIVDDEAFEFVFFYWNKLYQKKQ